MVCGALTRFMSSGRPAMCEFVVKLGLLAVVVSVAYSIFLA
jgi:hypothetical protein